MISNEKHRLMQARIVTVLLCRNAAVANRRVYRVVKSAIDYRRGDNAITHPLKVLTAYSTRHAFSIREIRRDNRENGGILPSTELYIKPINELTRSSRLSAFRSTRCEPTARFICFTPRRGLHVSLAATDIYPKLPLPREF